MKLLSYLAWSILAVIILGAAITFCVADMFVSPILRLIKKDDENRTGQEW